MKMLGVFSSQRGQTKEVWTCSDEEQLTYWYKEAEDATVKQKNYK